VASQQEIGPDKQVSGGSMKSRLILFVVAGLALSVPSAFAKDCYFKVLSPQTPMAEKADFVPIEKTLTFPIVIERASTITTDIAGRPTKVLLEETTALPVMLERTSVAKPHHWPISFGVWP